MQSTAEPITQQEPTIFYPESDGQPMAENTRQFRWIVRIKENLEALFRERADVFVAGDLLWYPVEGRRDLCRAPDALVVFGRPKGDRGSYRQWEEDGLAPQVVFEVQSPSNTFAELLDKLTFYETYGVEEYYLYDPEPQRTELAGFQRQAGRLQRITAIDGWVSPRLGIRFDLSGAALQLIGPDGRPFEDFTAVLLQRQQAEAARAQAEQRAEQLAARLRELGIDPDAVG